MSLQQLHIFFILQLFFCQLRSQLFDLIFKFFTIFLSFTDDFDIICYKRTQFFNLVIGNI